MYLPKRAEKELKLLEAQLEDEQNLFLNEGEKRSWIAGYWGRCRHLEARCNLQFQAS